MKNGRFPNRKHSSGQTLASEMDLNMVLHVQPNGHLKKKINHCTN